MMAVICLLVLAIELAVYQRFSILFIVILSCLSAIYLVICFLSLQVSWLMTFATAAIATVTIFC